MKQKQQVVAALMGQLSQRSVNIEAKLPDPEGRARRDNIRIYGVPDEAEGNNISIFLENSLRKLLDFPQDMNLDTERAYRALLPKPPNPHATAEHCRGDIVIQLMLLLRR